MKHRHFILFIALLASIVWCGQTCGQGPCPRPTITYSPDFCVDGIYYRILKGGTDVELTRAEGTNETVRPYNRETFIVPESVTYEDKTYPVIRIGEGAFIDDQTIKKIVLPDCIKDFDGYSFAFSTIEEFNYPASLLRIGDYAFQFCENLESIVIPDQVHYLGEGAFCSCVNMKTFTFGRQIIQAKENLLGSTCWVYPSTNSGGGLWKYCISTELRYLYCPLDTPPGIVEFETHWYYDGAYYIYHMCTLRIPVGTKEKYESASVWGWFRSIEEDPSLNSSLPEMADDCEAIRVEGGRIVGAGVIEGYDLGGREIARGVADELPQLPAGFYIVRNSHTTAKIAIR